MSLTLYSHFREAELWTCRYQRNNKRNGMKNLRCFPACTDAHRLRGFCGRPAYVGVNNPERKRLFAWAGFYKVPGSCENDEFDKQFDCGPVVGTVMTASEIAPKVRSKSDPLKPWIDGEIQESENSDPSVSTDNLRTSSFVEFTFNRNKKGWHYSWVANKHTCDSQHTLRCFVFEEISDQVYRLIETVDSPRFTMFCRRRQRQNLERLPVQLKMQLELQEAANKSKSGGDRAPVSKLPRCIPVQAGHVDVVTAKKGIVEEEKEDTDRLSAISGTSTVPEVTVTRKRRSIHDKLQKKRSKIEGSGSEISIDERKFLLFHIMRALLRLDFKTANARSKALIKRSSSFKAAALSPTTKSREIFDDFEPYDGLDFSLLHEADLSSVEPIGQTIQFVDIIKEFAHFLIEEDTFTRDIERALAAHSNSDPDLCNRVAVGVLLDLLTEFLRKFNITVDEMFHLLKEQVWDQKDSNNPREQARKTGVATGWRSAANISGLLASGEHLQKIKKATKEVLDHVVTHYAKTVNSGSDSPHASSLKKSPSFPVSRSLNPKSAAWTGTWTRPLETLNAIEDIRVTMGVPWVLRKLIRKMETNIKLTYTGEFLEIQNGRKLLSSGYQRYVLDGKEHPYSLPPPIPMERSKASATYAGTLIDGVLRLTVNYTPLKRIYRFSEITPCGSRLESVVKYQTRTSESTPWTDKLVVDCSAVRTEDEVSLTDLMSISDPLDPADTIDFSDFSWLQNPCDDFAMSF